MPSDRGSPSYKILPSAFEIKKSIDKTIKSPSL